jgi:CheY-like chemotaxis protein
MNLTCKILHVEDSDDDSFFFQQVLMRLLFTGIYRRVNSIDGAINYLSGQYEFSDRQLFPLPDVIVMDTALPGKKQTHELMTWMQERPEFSRLVKVVLTGAIAPDAKQDWLQRGITGVLLKGVSLAGMSVSVGEILMRCDVSDTAKP